MADYKKLYATLLGRVDDALQYMVYDINDARRMLKTAEMLRDAIQAVEETYIQAADGEDATPPLQEK